MPSFCSTQAVHFPSAHTAHINIARFAHESPNVMATSSFDKTIKVRDGSGEASHRDITGQSRGSQSGLWIGGMRWKVVVGEAVPSLRASHFVSSRRVEAL